MRLYNPLNAYLNDEKKIISARVSQIDVSKDGLKHTRPFVITRAFNQLEKVTNLGELQAAIQEGLLRSEELGLFTSVIVSLDKDEEAIANGISDAVRVVVRCDESEHRKKYRIGTSFTTQGEGKAEIGFTHTNFFGLGDREEVDLNIGRYKDLSFLGRLRFPQVFNGSGNLTLGAYLFGVKQISDLLKEKAHGISITNEITKRHSIAYELEWRNLMNVNNGPKDADDASTDQATRRSNLWTQSSSNASIKSAITHVYRHDGRDDVIDPSRGYFFRAATVCELLIV
jgi:outer membrane protein insertion porin family